MSLLANLALQDQTDPSAENDQTGGDRSDASIARGKHRHPLPAVVSPPASNSPGNRNDSPAPVPKRRATVSVLSKALGATPEVASKLMAKAAAMKSGSFSRNRRRIMDDEDADPDDDADPPADQENHNSADENVPSPRPAAPAGRGGNRLGADFFRVSGTAPAPSSGSSSARRNGSARAAPAPDFEFDEFTGEVTEVDKDADGQTGDAEEEKNRRQREIEKKQEQTRNVQRRKLELQREAQERLTAAAAAATSGRPAKPVRDIAADPDVPVDVPDDGDDANAVISDEPEEPEYVPYRHPRHDLIETRLGPACPEDSFCYIRDVVKQMDPGSRPKEVEDLLAAVHADNYDTQDKVDVAMHIKALFDETIRAKANRKRRPDGEGPFFVNFCIFY